MDSNIPIFGELLQTLRKQKKIRQQFLADKLDVHRNTIGAWERGERLPDTRGIVLELARELLLDEDETKLLLKASLTEVFSSWMVPYQRNPFFTGREAFLHTLHQQLCCEQAVALSQSYALSGLGGIGKTQLALEYVYQHSQEYHTIFWVTAETADTLISSFISIAEQLELPEREEKDHQKIVQVVMRWFAAHKGWLLIFDNVESVSTLKPFLPVARQGAVLITTRLHALEGLTYILDLPPLSRKEGIQFLLTRARLIDPAGSPDAIPPHVLEEAGFLVDAMDGLPLALDQAGAYIERTGSSLSDYVMLFKTHQIHLLDERSLAANHPQSVVKTFLLSFEKLAQTNVAAADLLRVCAFLAPDHIPEELLKNSASYWTPLLQSAVVDPLAFNHMIEDLLALSLVKRLTEDCMLSIHRLVQAVLIDTMGSEEQRQWGERIVRAVNAIFPRNPKEDVASWPYCLRYLEQVQACDTLIQKHQLMLPEAADLLDRSGTYLREHASYTLAEPLYQHALHIGEQSLGSEHPQVAYPLYNLAILYRAQGKYTEAESLYQRVLHIREQSLGSEHPQVAHPLNGLANLYFDQGKYAEAEPLYQQALHIWEQSLGPEHPQVAYPLNGLANLYQKQGRDTEAEPLYRRALHIWEQNLGSEHPLVAHPLNGLAELYYEQGKYAEAESLYQRALHIWKQSFGSEHFDVAYPLNGLANVYSKQGKYELAEPLYRRALHIREQSLGPEHSDVAHPLNGLANLYLKQGKYELAEPLFARTLDIQEQTLMSNHPDLANTLYGFARFYETQGRLQKASALYQRAFIIQEEVYGSHHPKTIETRESLFAVMHRMSETEKVGQLDKEQLEQAGT